MTIRGFLSGGSVQPVRLSQVFDAVPYVGNGTLQTISTTVDIAEGGMIWIKRRDASAAHYLYDTVRGPGRSLSTDFTNAEVIDANSLTAFGSGSFSVGNSTRVNTSGATYIAYIFKIYPGFFDVVTHTGNGSTPYPISHNLNCRPGFITTKAINAVSDWPATNDFLASYSPYFQGIGSNVHVPGGGSETSAKTTQDAYGFGCGGAGGWVYSGGDVYSGGGHGGFGGGAGYSDFQPYFGGFGGQGVVVVEYGDEARLFTSGTSWTIPDGVMSIKVWCVGAGGSSGGDIYQGTGGGAGAVTYKTYSVTPGQTLSYIIGAAGVWGSTYNGGTTTATYGGVTITAPGGRYSGVGGDAAITNADGSVRGGYGSSGSGQGDGATILWGSGGAIGSSDAPTGIPVSSSYYTSSIGKSGGQAQDVSGLFAALTKITQVNKGFWLNLNTVPTTNTPYIYLTPNDFSVGTTINSSGTSYISYLWGDDKSANGIIKTFGIVYDRQTNVIRNSGNLSTEPAFMLTTKIQTDTGTFNMLGNTVSGLNSLSAMSTGYSGRSRVVSTSSSLAENDISTSDNYASQVGSTETGVSAIGPTVTPQSLWCVLSIQRDEPIGLSATDLFQPITYTGNGLSNRLITTGIFTDMVMSRGRNLNFTSGFKILDRWRHNSVIQVNNVMVVSDGISNAHPSSAITNGSMFDSQLGYGVSSETNYAALNTTGTNYISYAFRKYSKFFSISHIQGTGVNVNVPHTLDVVPELIMVRIAGSASLQSWHKSFSPNQVINMASTTEMTVNSATWDNTSPTESFIRLGSTIGFNFCVIYSFASYPGISKIDSYIGNGTSQTIDCGFATGSRFIMVKRVDAVGNCYIWDTARGITTSADPYVLLNSAAAEVTSDNSVGPHASGFIVNQNPTTDINVSGSTYIYFAIA